MEKEKLIKFIATIMEDSGFNTTTNYVVENQVIDIYGTLETSVGEVGVVAACKKDKVMLVGLSALMTTTVAAMEDTIKLLRKECPWAKVCVGGAVMTQEYADKIGADFYGKDAMDTVRYALDLFSKEK